MHHAATLERLVKGREDICICGIILTEVLQGIRGKSEFRKTKELFNALIYLPMPYSNKRDKKGLIGERPGRSLRRVKTRLDHWSLEFGHYLFFW